MMAKNDNSFDTSNLTGSLFPYDDSVVVFLFQGKRNGKSMHALSLRTRARTKKPSSSFDKIRAINKEIVHSLQLKNDTNRDPMMKSGFALQPRQKSGSFHKIHMFSDNVMIMKIPSKSQKVSIIKTDYITSLKKVSIVFMSGKSGRNK